MPLIAGGDILQFGLGPSFYGHIIFGHALAFLVTLRDLALMKNQQGRLTFMATLSTQVAQNRGAARPRTHGAEARVITTGVTPHGIYREASSRLIEPGQARISRSAVISR